MVLVSLEVGQVWPRRSGILGGYVLGYRDMVTKTSSPTRSEAAYRLQTDAPVTQLHSVRGYESHIRLLSLPHDSKSS